MAGSVSGDWGHSVDLHDIHGRGIRLLEGVVSVWLSCLRVILEWIFIGLSAFIYEGLCVGVRCLSVLWWFAGWLFRCIIDVCGGYLSVFVVSVGVAMCLVMIRSP